MQYHGPRLIAVAIDRDRSSQSALKWAAENLVPKGQTIILIHVKVKPSATGSSKFSSPSIPRLNLDGVNENSTLGGELDPETREIFLPFRVYCMRKDIHCQDILLEDGDIVKAILEFVSRIGVEVLVLGAGAKGSIFRFKSRDIPASVLKGVPDFCSVYIVAKGKIASTRSASRPAPAIHPLRQQILHQASNRSSAYESSLPPNTNLKGSRSDSSIQTMPNDYGSIKSPFSHRKDPNGKAYEISAPDTDISFVSSGRPSVDMFPSFSESLDSRLTPPRLSGFSDIDSHDMGRRSVDIVSTPELSYISNDIEDSQAMDDVEAEMRRLKQELKQTMEMYSSACREALSANHKAMELQRLKKQEQQRLEEARLAEEAAVLLAEKEKNRSRAAIEHAEAAQRIAELEAQKRLSAEMKALKEAEEKNKVLNRLSQSNGIRYRVYTIDEIEAATNYFDKSLKIGEGGYGPVYKCYLDHTPAAVKVLRPDAAQGRSQFQQEVEVLSCIRHPNMVLLLGACSEYGCLVYEYLSNGSLEDRLFRRGNTPPLTWQQRFRIAAEIGTGLLFLHQTKPEPLVHRDLKPANILLDRNFVSKISDVGLARLVPPSVADSVTQYRMTSTAGTFCYIDPEYQQTGMLGVKSDIYSLGIIFLQILTGKPPMGLTHHVERAIEKGMFAEMLDQSVPDWPFEEALCLAKLALKCSELRRKDRPDLGKVVMPELERLRSLADERIASSFVYNAGATTLHSQVSVPRDELSYPNTGESGYESSRSQPLKAS